MEHEKFIKYMDTPIGTLCIEGNRQSVFSVLFQEKKGEDSVVSGENEVLSAFEQLREYFEGSRKTFSLHLEPQGTAFQKDVWNALCRISFGKHTSYLELAKQLGDAKKIRAVGRANGMNPIAIVIPCHRVIGSHGELTGYAGGLHRKEWLLKHEGNESVSQMSLF